MNWTDTSMRLNFLEVNRITEGEKQYVDMGSTFIGDCDSGSRWGDLSDESISQIQFHHQNRRKK